MKIAFNMNNSELKLSAQRALLFNIIESVRFIFIENRNNRLLLYIYADKELSENERDIYSAVLGEISGDFISLDDSASEILFVFTSKPFEEINNPGLLVYARYED